MIRKLKMLLQQRRKAQNKLSTNHWTGCGFDPHMGCLLKEWAPSNWGYSVNLWKRSQASWLWQAWELSHRTSSAPQKKVTNLQQCENEVKHHHSKQDEPTIFSSLVLGKNVLLTLKYMQQSLKIWQANATLTWKRPMYISLYLQREKLELNIKC